MSNDMSNGGLPQPRRTIKDRVIKRFVPLLRRLDTDPQGFFHPILADVLLQGLRAQHRVDTSLFVRDLRANNSLGHREGTSLVVGLFLLRRWEVLGWRRQGTLPRRCRTPAIRWAGQTAFGRIRKVQLHLLQLALRDPPPILIPTASRYSRVAYFTIASGTRTTDGQQIGPEWGALNECWVAVLANLFGLGHAGGRIAFRTLTASLPNAFGFTRLFGLHGIAPSPNRSTTSP